MAYNEVFLQFMLIITIYIDMVSTKIDGTQYSLQYIWSLLSLLYRLLHVNINNWVQIVAIIWCHIVIVTIVRLNISWNKCETKCVISEFLRKHLTIKTILKYIFVLKHNRKLIWIGASVTVYEINSTSLSIVKLNFIL